MQEWNYHVKSVNISTNNHVITLYSKSVSDSFTSSPLSQSDKKQVGYQPCSKIGNFMLGQKGRESRNQSYIWFNTRCNISQEKLLDYLWCCAVSHSSLDKKCLSRKKPVCFNACLKKYEACHQQITLKFRLILVLRKPYFFSCQEQSQHLVRNMDMEFKQDPQKTLQDQNSA